MASDNNKTYQIIYNILISSTVLTATMFTLSVCAENHEQQLLILYTFIPCKID